MKIEFVGGPRCGDVERVPDLISRVSTWDWQGNAVMYARRDGSTTATPMYGKGGYRLYEFVKDSR